MKVDAKEVSDMPVSFVDASLLHAAYNLSDLSRVQGAARCDSPLDTPRLFVLGFVVQNCVGDPDDVSPLSELVSGVLSIACPYTYRHYATIPGHFYSTPRPTQGPR